MQSEFCCCCCRKKIHSNRNVPKASQTNVYTDACLPLCVMSGSCCIFFSLLLQIAMMQIFFCILLLILKYPRLYSLTLWLQAQWTPCAEDTAECSLSTLPMWCHRYSWAEQHFWQFLKLICCPGLFPGLPFFESFGSENIRELSICHFRRDQKSDGTVRTSAEIHQRFRSWRTTKRLVQHRLTRQGELYCTYCWDISAVSPTRSARLTDFFLYIVCPTDSYFWILALFQPLVRLL